MDAYQDALLNALDRLGKIVFKDDEKDFPRFSFPGHPSPVHHWQWGLMMQGGAKVVRGLSELLEVVDMFDAPDPLEAEFQQILRGR